MKETCSEGFAILYFTNSPLMELATHIFQSKIRTETPPKNKVQAKQYTKENSFYARFVNIFLPSNHGIQHARTRHK